MFFEFFLCFFLYSLDHVETNFHLLHSALVNFSAFEDLFCDFDSIFHFFKNFLVSHVGLILDLAVLVFFFLLSIFDYLLLLVSSVLVDELQETTDSFLGDSLIILLHLNLIKYSHYPVSLII